MRRFYLPGAGSSRTVGSRGEAFHAATPASPVLLKGMEMDKLNLIREKAIIIASKLSWIAYSLDDSKDVDWTFVIEDGKTVEKSGPEVAINNSCELRDTANFTIELVRELEFHQLLTESETALRMLLEELREPEIPAGWALADDSP
jgi:hypothetical protein